jgi:hypothetical protein
LVAVDNTAATAKIQIGGANHRLYGTQQIGNVAFATVPLARLAVPPLPRTTGVDWSTASYVQPSAGGSLAPTMQLCVKPFRLRCAFLLHPNAVLGLRAVRIPWARSCKCAHTCCCVSHSDHNDAGIAHGHNDAGFALWPP